MRLNSLQTRLLTALRSGEYRQVRGDWTRGANSGCALGVLTLVDSNGRRRGRPDHRTLQDADINDIMQSQVMSWNDESPRHNGKSFSQIADYLEAWWSLPKEERMLRGPQSMPDRVRALKAAATRKRKKWLADTMSEIMAKNPLPVETPETVAEEAREAALV